MLVVLFGTALVVLALTYGVTSVDMFWDGLHAVRGHEAQGHSTFLKGAHSETGWWYYFPTTLFIKTPIPLLVLLVLAVVSLLRRRKDWPLANTAFLFLPVVVILGVVLFVRLQIGLNFPLKRLCRQG